MASSTSKLFFVSAILILSASAPLTAKEVSPASSLAVRLKVAEGEEPAGGCWESLIQLQACTGEVILFFMNGETRLGRGCCEAIEIISSRCWPAMMSALGFTVEETDVLAGYCSQLQPPSSSLGPNN